MKGNEKKIEKIIKILERGGIILYPTDTIWGLGCDANNDNAIKKIYQIKKRIENKSLISLVSDKKMLKNYTNDIPEFDITTKPTTVIYGNVKNLSTKIITKERTAAIRITSDKFCKKLIKIFGNAIVSTSANISGDSTPRSFSEISNYIKKNVDYIVNLRLEDKMEIPSSIIKINKDKSITKIR